MDNNNDDDINVCSRSEAESCPTGRPEGALTTVNELELMDINVCSRSEAESCPTGRTNVYESERVDINAIIDNMKYETYPTKSGLSNFKTNNNTVFNIGVDEVGRGSLISRVYVAAVVLSDKEDIDYSQIIDSKKFHSKEKLKEIAEYIKTIALYWAIEYEDENSIDEINILQATQKAMHKAIKKIYDQIISSHINVNSRSQVTNCVKGQSEGEKTNIYKSERMGIKLDEQSYKSSFVYPQINLWIDGNYFKPFMATLTNGKSYQIPYTTIEQGDNKFSNIAAASILAKNARDSFIVNELCKISPELIDYYKINENMGYGSKRHIDGIKAYGISKWHRKTFGICRIANSSDFICDNNIKKSLENEELELEKIKAHKLEQILLKQKEKEEKEFAKEIAKAEKQRAKEIAKAEKEKAKEIAKAEKEKQKAKKQKAKEQKKIEKK